MQADKALHVPPPRALSSKGERADGADIRIFEIFNEPELTVRLMI